MSIPCAFASVLLAAGVLAAAALGGCSELRDPSFRAPVRTANASAAARPVPDPAGTAPGARARALAEDARMKALESRAGAGPVPWTTDDGEASGEAVPGTPFTAGGRPCRDYTQRIHAGGQTRESRGVACRNADGSWSAG